MWGVSQVGTPEKRTLVKAVFRTWGRNFALTNIRSESIYAGVNRYACLFAYYHLPHLFVFLIVQGVVIDAFRQIEVF